MGETKLKFVSLFNDSVSNVVIQIMKSRYVSS
jgi:hypothetical protein